MTSLNFSRCLALTFCIGISVIANSCGGSLFNVKPVIELPPLAENAKMARGGGMIVRIAPLLEDEESQELFEANLPLSGVLPVRVELEYETGSPVELRRARFRLHDDEGREWKLLSTKQAISRILKANGVFAYNPNSRKQFSEEFAAYSLDLTNPVSPENRRRQGFLFFATPNGQPVDRGRGLRLKLERVPQPLELVVR